MIMPSFTIVASAIVQLFLLVWGWVCSSIHNLAEFFKATAPSATLPHFAPASSREPSHNQGSLFENAFGAAASDVMSGIYGPSKGTILPVHTIAQGQSPELRDLQHATKATWSPPAPINLTTVPAVQSSSLASRHLGDPPPAVVFPPDLPYSLKLQRTPTRTFQAVASPRTEYVGGLGSVILQKPLPALRSSPTTIVQTVASSSTQENRLSLYKHENTFQQVVKSSVETDALQIFHIQVSSSVDAVDLSGPFHFDRVAASIKTKRRAVVSIPMLAFEASADSLFKIAASTTLEGSTPSSGPTASASQDESLLDVDAIIALAGTLCHSTSSSTRRSPDVVQASDLQSSTTSLPFPAHEDLPIEVAGNSEFAFGNSDQKCIPFEGGSNHIPQYDEGESALPYLQRAGRNSLRPTRVPSSLETIQEEEEPSFYDDILATPSPPYHHESTFSDNTQSSQGLTPTTPAAGWKKRFSLVDILPRSGAVLAQKNKRRSAPSTLGLGWFKTGSSPLQRETEQSPDVKPVSSLRPLILPMQVAMRGHNTSLKHKHSSTASTHSTKRCSWIKNLISHYSSSSWAVSPPFLNVIPATPLLNDKPGGTISNCAPLSIDPKFLSPTDPSLEVEPDDSYNDAFSPVVIEPTPIESYEGAIAEKRRSQSLDELIALIDSYDFEAGRVKGHSSLVDLSSSENQLDWTSTWSSSSSSSDDGSWFNESEDSICIEPPCPRIQDYAGIHECIPGGINTLGPVPSPRSALELSHNPSAPDMSFSFGYDADASLGCQQLIFEYILAEDVHAPQNIPPTSTTNAAGHSLRSTTLQEYTRSSLLPGSSILLCLAQTPFTTSSLYTFASFAKNTSALLHGSHIALPIVPWDLFNHTGYG